MEFWEELEPVVRRAAHHWADPTASVALCRYVWETLIDEVDRDPVEPMARAEQIALILGVGQLHEEFCNVADGPGVGTEISVETPSSLVDPIAVGALAARYDVDLYGWADLDIDSVLTAIAPAAAKLVSARLKAAWGESALFASLWATRWPKTTYPLDEALVSEIVNDVTPDKATTYEWLGARG